MSRNYRRERGAVVFRMAAVAAGLLSIATNAAALWQDKLEVFAAETVTVEDNVFRVADSATVPGSSEKGDTITATSVGFNLDIPFSRQRFRAGTRWSDVHYDHFSDLDHVSRDARLLWLWQVGNNWNGEVGYNETKALASFTNFQGRVPDPVKTQLAYGNAIYMMAPSWRLRVGASGQEQRHENSLRQANDIDVVTADLTASYVSAANNSIGLSVRGEGAEYPNPQIVGVTPFKNDYRQRSVGVVGDWTLTGKSRVNARADRVSREYDMLGQRDFDGTTFRAAYDWKATGKLTLNAEARRDISSTEDIQTSFVLVKGIALRPTFIFSEKIRFSGIADYSIREYLGDPGLVLGTTAARRDRARLFLATVSYQPLRKLILSLSYQHEERSSNLPLNAYDADIVALNGRFAF